jgi:D-aminopeptidase
VTGLEGLDMTDLDETLLARRIERLLAPWDRSDGPGVAVGVSRGGRIVVQRAAGMANIEQGVPIGPATTFRIASVSKQFTCAALLMLAAEGKLSVDDDVRTHLPELADYGVRITLDHLMHNCSGLRDMLEIMRLGGTDLAMPVTAADLMAGICRQRTLNFAPGTRYLYSNTNFLLLGRIVERVSGEKLRDFLAKRIFAPAGMNMTRMVEGTTEVVPGLATGYFPSSAEAGLGPWVQARHGFPVHGEGGLVSSVADLLLWERNYTTGRVGGRTLVAALAETAPFANGLPNGYARGLQTATVRGLPTQSHGGLWPGYRTEFLRLPAADAAVVVISNCANADPYQFGQRILDIIADDLPQATPRPALPPHATLQQCVGRYLDPTLPMTVEIAFDAAGNLTGSSNGLPFLLRAEADGRLAASRSAADFAMRLIAGGAAIEVEQDAGVTSIFRRLAEAATLPADLPGVYTCPEMAATWTISAGADGMAATVAGPVANAGPWEVTAVAGDIVRIWVPAILVRGWLDVRVERDGSGRIVGLTANANRVKNLALVRNGGATQGEEA